MSPDKFIEQLFDQLEKLKSSQESKDESDFERCVLDTTQLIEGFVERTSTQISDEQIWIEYAKTGAMRSGLIQQAMIVKGAVQPSLLEDTLSFADKMLSEHKKRWSKRKSQKLEFGNSMRVLTAR